jgi:hypothetical protein
MAAFGAVFLLVAGIILPVVCGVLLWRNKDQLKDPLFMAKVCLARGLRSAGPACG